MLNKQMVENRFPVGAVGEGLARNFDKMRSKKKLKQHPFLVDWVLTGCCLVQQANGGKHVLRCGGTRGPGAKP